MRISGSQLLPGFGVALWMWRRRAADIGLAIGIVLGAIGLEFGLYRGLLGFEFGRFSMVQGSKLPTEPF